MENETKPKTPKEAISRIFDRLNNDPVYLKKWQDNFALSLIHKESQLICSVINEMYFVGSVGDLIMYGQNHNHVEDLKKEAHTLFYQWHGCGD